MHHPPAERVNNKLNTNASKYFVRINPEGTQLQKTKTNKKEVICSLRFTSYSCL